MYNICVRSILWVQLSLRVHIVSFAYIAGWWLLDVGTETTPRSVRRRCLDNAAGSARQTIRVQCHAPSQQLLFSMSLRRREAQCRPHPDGKQSDSFLRQWHRAIISNYSSMVSGQFTAGGSRGRREKLCKITTCTTISNTHGSKTHKKSSMKHNIHV